MTVAWCIYRQRKIQKKNKIDWVTWLWWMKCPFRVRLLPELLPNKTNENRHNQRRPLICLNCTFTIPTTDSYYMYHTVSPDPQCARFRRIFTCLPVGLISITQCILPGFVIAATRHLNWVNETGYNALCHIDLHNRRTGKDATKPCRLGLFGQSAPATQKI